MGDGGAAPAFAELGARCNFSLLDGASHPEELVGTAAALGLAGLGVCDTNSLAGAVRAHAAAKRTGLRFAVGGRLRLDDGAEYLVWPADGTAYGRLTRLLSLGRTRGPKGARQPHVGPTARGVDRHFVDSTAACESFESVTGSDRQKWPRDARKRGT